MSDHTSKKCPESSDQFTGIQKKALENSTPHPYSADAMQERQAATRAVQAQRSHNSTQRKSGSGRGGKPEWIRRAGMEHTTIPALDRNRGQRPQWVQRALAGEADQATNAAIHESADRGVQGSGGRLPHLAAIQKSFGRHDVTQVQAHLDSKAAQANAEIGAEAYATGNHVAFRQWPDLHTAAHEAAHVVQQRTGVSLPGDVGQAGDQYERHADEAADAVVQGKSAEAILNRITGTPQSPQGAQPSQQAQETQKKTSAHRSGIQAGIQTRKTTQRKAKVQQKPVQMRRSQPPPPRGPLTAGGIDVRRINPDQINTLLRQMQSAAAQRRGHSTFGGDDPASISGSGVSSRVRTFLSNASNVRRGSWDSGWVDDNGSARFFGSWDYSMRVRITTIEYQNPTPTGASGTHGSSATGGTSGHASDSRSQTDSTSASGQLEGSVGGHEGAPGGGGSGGIEIGQTNTEGSGTQEGGAGGETFQRGQEGYNRYNATLVATFNIAFRPGSTLGMQNVRMSAQNFDGSSPFGTLLFDYTSL